MYFRKNSNRSNFFQQKNYDLILKIFHYLLNPEIVVKMQTELYQEID